MKAMLATNFQETTVTLDQLLTNPEVWQISYKADGDRLLIDCRTGLEFLNRDGAPMSRGVPRQVKTAMEGLRGTGVVLDCELTKEDGQLWLFDMPDAGRLHSPASPFSERWEHLLHLYDGWFSKWSMIHVMPVADPGTEPEFVETLIATRAEGFIAKRWDAAYKEGPQRSTAWLKVKFRRDVHCFISDRERDGKQNWVLSMSRGRGRLPVEVGEVSALTGDGPRLKIGDVVDVTILYATPNGRLYQPVKPRRRRDLRRCHTHIDQLEPHIHHTKAIPKELIR